MKNKNYYFRMAILKTIVTALIYLIIPLFAKWYIPKVDDYWGYAAFSSVVLIIINSIILFQAWMLVFDKNYRKEYNTED